MTAERDPRQRVRYSLTKEGTRDVHFCLGSHPPEDCEKVKDIKERKKLLLKFGRCFDCIEKGHRSRDCSVTIECKLCKGQHSSCLCVAKPQRLRGGIKIDQWEVLVIGPEITSAPNLWVRNVG